MRRGARFHPSHPRPFTPPIAGARPIAYLLGQDGEEVEVRAGGYEPHTVVGLIWR